MSNLKKIYESKFMPEFISKKYFSGKEINILGAAIIKNVFFAVVEEQETDEVETWEDFI